MELVNKKGFTLMELLIVVAIMLILATVGLSNFIFSLKKSHDAERKNDLSTIAKGLEAFANDFGTYPNSNASGEMIACDFSGTGLYACDWGADPMSAYVGTPPAGDVVTYLSTLPNDPVSGQTYFYEKTSSGFNLYAALENTSDPSYKSGLTVSCGSVTCNYQLTESGVN